MLLHTSHILAKTISGAWVWSSRMAHSRRGAGYTLWSLIGLQNTYVWTQECQGPWTPEHEAFLRGCALDFQAGCRYSRRRCPDGRQDSSMSSMQASSGERGRHTGDTHDAGDLPMQAGLFTVTVLCKAIPSSPHLGISYWTALQRSFFIRSKFVGVGVCPMQG
jgi:hypothetical protein